MSPVWSPGRMSVAARGTGRNPAAFHRSTAPPEERRHWSPIDFRISCQGEPSGAPVPILITAFSAAGAGDPGTGLTAIATRVPQATALQILTTGLLLTPRSQSTNR